MKTLFFRFPKNMPSQERNAFMIATLIAIAHFLAVFYYLYVGWTSGTWQFLALAAISFVLGALSGIGATLSRRGQPTRGIILVMCALAVSYPPIAILISGLGSVLGFALMVVGPMSAFQILPQRSNRAITVITIVSGLATLLLDVFGSEARPALSGYFIPLLAVSVTGLVGFFIVRQFRDYSLRTKLIVSLVGLTLISIIIVGFISSSISSVQINKQVGTNLSAITSSLAREIAEIVSNDVDVLSSLSLNKFLQDTVTTADTNATSSQAVLDRLDQQWKNAADNDPLIAGILNNELAEDLKEFQSKFPDFLEVFVTDKYGAIIASTDRTSDYYQADEEWWQAAWNNGKGGLYISQVTFDESTNAYAIDVALPISLHNSSTPIGVLRSTIDINVFTALTSSVKLGQTGRAKLKFQGDEYMDPDGAGLSKLTPEELAQLASLPETYGQMTFKGSPSLVSQSLVSAPFSKHNEIIGQLGWTVIVHQDISEAHASVTLTTRTISFVAVFIALIIALVAQFLAQFLVGPISRLTTVANQVTAGDVKAQANIETVDEIGTLATAFNTMTSRLREFIDTLEGRVAERTSSLVLAAEVGRSVSQVRELHLMLKDAAEIIRSRFDLYYAQVYLMNPAQNALLLEAGTGTVGAELLGRGHRLPLNTASINGRAAVEKHSIVISDTAASTTFRPNSLLPDTKSEMAVPLMVGKNVVGVLDLQSEKTGTLNQDILPAFEALAGQLAIAIQNANLLTEAEEARAEVEAQARRLVRKNWEEHLDAIHQPEQTGFVFEGNAVIPLADAANIEPPAEGNVIEVPIAITGEPLGTLAVKMDAQELTPQNTELVNIIARQVAQQIENLRLLESAERYRSEAEQAARRETREGWQEYINTKTGDGLTFLYDLNEVRHYNNSNGKDDASALTLPLRVRDETIGKVSVHGLASDDRESLEFVNAVAERLGAHIESLRQHDRTQSALTQSEKLFNASRLLTQAMDLQELVAATVNTLNILEVNRAVLTTFGYDSAGEIEQLTIIANWWNGTGHEITPVGTRYPLEVIRAMPMFVSPTPVFFNDTFNDKRVDAATMTLVKRLNLRAVAVLPLHLGSHQIGALILEAEDPHNFTPDETRLFISLAPQIATVLENRQQYERAKQQADREATLNAIGQKIQSATTVESVLQIAARELGRALGAPLTIAQLGIKEYGDNRNGGNRR